MVTKKTTAKTTAKKPVVRRTKKKVVAKRAPGRPRGFNRAKVVADVCEVTGRSNKGIRRILKAVNGPSYPMWSRWLTDDAEFVAQYARAKESQADYLVEEMLEIADETVEFATDPQRNRLRVDTRKWIASKLKPKKYGDKVEHSGPGGGPIPIATIPLDISAEDAAKCYKDIMGGND